MHGLWKHKYTLYINENLLESHPSLCKFLVIVLFSELYTFDMTFDGRGQIIT